MTNRERSLVSLSVAAHAVGNALDELRVTCQSAHYPQPGQWEKARAQYRLRREKLEDVLNDLQAEIDTIQAAKV